MKAFSTLLLAMTMALPAFADRIATKKDWALDEIKLSNGQVLCVASTSTKEKKSIYSLEVHKVKNSESPVEVIMREVGPQQVGTMTYGDINGERTLFNQYAVNGNTNYFWYLPDEMALAVWKMKAHKEFDLRPLVKESVSDIDFRLKGAADILALMEKRCNDRQDLVNTRLAELTNHSSSFDQAPQALSPQSVVQMRDTYFAMGAKLNQIVYVEAQIEKLVAQYRPYINERNSLNTEKSNLENVTIPGIKADQMSTSQRLSQTQARLRQLVSLIPQALKTKQQKQKNYDNAYAAIAPHIPQHDRLVSQLNNASHELDSAENALSQVISELRQNRREISDLDRESSQLTSEIRNIRSRLPQVRQNVRQASQAYNAYNPQAEKRKLLNQSPGYNQKKAQLQNKKQQLTQAQNRLNTKVSELRTARAQLNACKAKANVDCSAQQTRVNQLQQRVATLRTQVNTLESEIRPLRQQVKNIEDRVDRQVNAESKRLRDNLNKAENRLNQLTNRLDNKVQRRNRIENVLIPNLRERNRYLISRQNTLESEIDYLERKVASSSRELDAFERRVGWNQLEATLDRTQRELRSATSHHASLVNEQSRLKNLEVSDQNRLIQLAKDLQNNQNRLAAVNARLVTLNQILADFDAAKAPLDSQLASLNSQLMAQKAKYMSFIP